MTPRLVALIPARGGSQRVPRKSIRPLAGHPLLAYTIAAARSSGLFKRILVSTDSQEIAGIARRYGAETPFMRPAEMAGPLSPDIEWLRHALVELQGAGDAPEAFALLRPTSPFRQAATIQRAADLFFGTPGADSLRAVEPCQEHPGKMWIRRGAFLSPLLPFTLPTGQRWQSSPYQALPPVLVQNASLEMAWTRVPLEKGTLEGDQVVPFLTQGAEGFDINTETDWATAEALVQSGEATLPALDWRSSDG